jgi:hypothetical protein
VRHRRCVSSLGGVLGLMSYQRPLRIGKFIGGNCRRVVSNMPAASNKSSSPRCCYQFLSPEPKVDGGDACVDLRVWLLTFV